MIDLGSKAGTKLNNEKIDLQVPKPVISGNTLSFGYSTRTYKVKIDFTEVE